MTGQLLGLSSRRADVVLVLLLIGLTLAIRLAFYGTAPPLLNPDSAGYYVPARNLVYGDGFDLGLRRTPTYPLFLAGIISFVGEDLQAIVTVQHLLFGPLLAGLTFLLGLLLAGRWVALLAAALTAVSGPLLLYEHYLMTEVPFAILLLAVLSVTVLATQRASLRWAALAGVLFGLLILCRPSGQILAPIIAVALLLLMPATWRRRTAALGALIACTLVVVVPWMAYNAQTQGTFAIAGSGRFLLARTLKMDPGGFTFALPPGKVESGLRADARKIVQEEAARTKPGSVAQRFRDELGLTDAEAYPLMQSFAIEAIRNKPGYFITSTLEAFWEIVQGVPINIRREGAAIADADFERRARAALRKPVYPLNAPRAQALVSIYDPSRYGIAIPALFVLGLVAAGLRHDLRWLLLPGLATLALIGGSAALVGGELRYRFPQEPLIALVVSGAVVAAVQQAAVLIWRQRKDMPKAVAGSESRA